MCWDEIDWYGTLKRLSVSSIGLHIYFSSFSNHILIPFPIFPFLFGFMDVGQNIQFLFVEYSLDISLVFFGISEVEIE